MSNFVVRTYRNVIPVSLRDRIYNSFLKNLLDVERPVVFYLKSKAYLFFSKFITFKSEKKQSWVSLGKYGKNQYPRVDLPRYSLIEVQPFYDEQKCLPYVFHKNEKLYFPRIYQNRMVEMYRTLLMEQDEKCAHKYIKSDEILNNKVLLDVGAAEGIISLDAIKRVAFIYLFEYDEDWIEALTATFEPWKDKVQVVKKYVSDENDELSVTLDSFFEGKSKDNLFIKMDIEGAEMKALHGASNLLTNGVDLNFSICVYHKEEDRVVIPAYLQQYGYECELSDGYLLMGWLFRKGVVRSLEKR